MKTIFKCTLLMTMMIFFTGCFPTGENFAVSDDRMPDNIFSDAEKIDNFSLSLTLPRDRSSELNQITASAMRWNKDTVLGAFQGDKTVTSEKEYSSDRYPQEKRTVIMFDDDSYVSYEAERLNYNNKKANDEYSYQIFFSNLEIFYENRDYSYVSELEGFSKANAVKRVRELAEKLGITHLAEPIVYGLTAEEANKYFLAEKQFYNSGDYEYTEWERADEVYFITFPLLYNGIPSEINAVSVPESSYDGSYVKAIVTQNSITYLSCEGITMPDYAVGKSVKVNFSAEDILSKIVSAYSQIVLSDNVDFYDCELTYAPIEKLSNGESILAPVWRFDYALSGVTYDEILDKNLEYSTRYNEIYNAETGNRIAFEWQH